MLSLLPIYSGVLLLVQEIPDVPLPLPPPPPDLMASIGQLIVAWQGRQWVLGGALLVSTLVALSKTGWFGTWAARIPPKARPWLVILVSIATIASSEIAAGVNWKNALLNAFYAAATAVFGHQVVVQGMRNGKEIVPKAPYHKPDDGPGGGPSGPSDPVDPRTIVLDLPNPTPSTIRFAGIPPLRWARRAFAVGGLSLVLSTMGCNTAWWQAFQADPVGVITNFVTYCMSFIDNVRGLWAVLAPLLGKDGAQATTDFNNGVATLQQALVVAQDAVQAAVAAKQPTIDIAAIMKPVQDAVARVLAIIARWRASTPAGALGAEHDSATHQGTQLAHWQFPKGD